MAWIDAEREQDITDAAKHWWQPCPCGSGLIAASCRCRIRKFEEDAAKRRTQPETGEPVEQVTAV